MGTLVLTLGHVRSPARPDGLPGAAGRLSRTSIPLRHLAQEHQDSHMSSKVRLVYAI
jgi:hypothetical protein